MDTNSLQTFIEVMRRGSFAAVARTQGVAPSSISRQIAALEEEIGVRLFQRTTRRLSPTEAGLVYFDRVAPLLEELARARGMATDVADHPKGRLRLTAPVSFAQIGIVPLLPELKSRYPELDFELVLTDRMVDLVAERIDIAVRLGRLTDSGFVARRLCPMRYVVCASPGYIERCGKPESPSELVEHEACVFPMQAYRTRWRFRSAAGGVADHPVRGTTVVSHALSLGQCAAAGMGIALLPRWVVWRELRDGALVDLFAEYDVTATDFDASAWLLFPSRQYLPLKVRVFVDFVLSRFQEGMPWEDGGEPRT